MLFIAADPTNQSRFRLGEEFREIQEKLQLSKERERFVLSQRLSVRPADLSQALLDVNPNIIHFSGHGESSGALCVENRLGEAQIIPVHALKALIERFADHIDCIILSACYSEVQANALADHINYVIGMNNEIGDRAAIAFSIGFYQALGAGRSIEEAFRFGRIQIQLEGIPEYSTPILFQQKKTVPVDNAHLDEPGEEVVSPKSGAHSTHTNKIELSPRALNSNNASSPLSERVPDQALAERWSEFLGMVRATAGVSVQAALRSVRDMAVTENEVLFAFGQNEFTYDMVRKPEVLAKITTILSTLLERSVQVECKLGDVAALSDEEKLRKRWKEFVTVVRQRAGVQVQAALKAVCHISISGNTAIFAFGTNEFSRDLVLRPSSLSEVSTILAEFLERKITLECTLGDIALN